MFRKTGPGGGEILDAFAKGGGECGGIRGGIHGRLRIERLDGEYSTETINFSQCSFGFIM
jgi:hypothetical protein